MARSNLVLATLFAVAHFAFVAPFVPVANVVPVGLGMLSMSAMGLTLILAARWRLVDRIMGGPDKSYAAHRWLGFLALAGALGHWGVADDFGSGLIPGLGDAGEDLGTLAAVGLLVLSLQAMIRAIPYHLWKIGHMLMGPVFVLAATHTLVVASPADMGVAPWGYMFVVSLVGAVAWLQTLVRKVAPSQLVTVSKVAHFDGGVDVTFTSDNPMPKFKPGQFATLAHNRARAEAHPFTIAGGDVWTRRFVIRAAGDWTSDFVGQVKKGDNMRVGRGVGRFLPQVTEKRGEQLWVAGGVGITPFLAALEQLEPDHGPRVTLIFCMKSRDTAGALVDVEVHAARLPQVELVILSDEEGNRLSRDILARYVQGMDKKAQVYLCGPEGLKTLVGEVWKSQGMKGRMHSERFDFRGAMGLTELMYNGRPLVETALDLTRRRRPQFNALSRS